MPRLEFSCLPVGVTIRADTARGLRAALGSGTGKSGHTVCSLVAV